MKNFKLIDELLDIYKDAEKKNKSKLQWQVLYALYELGVFDDYKTDAEDDGEGRWITTENKHKVHINGEGEPDKGNKHVISAMKGGSSGGTIPNSTGRSMPLSRLCSSIKVKGVDKKRLRHIMSHVRKSTKDRYDRGRQVANEQKNRALFTFTSHGGDHVDQVIEKTNEAADALDQIQGDNGLYGEPVDRELMLVAAQYHDTGMDGGVNDYPDGDSIRSQHGVNSALHALEDADQIKELGVSPSQAALLIFAHTKSKSGIEDLSNPDDWNKGLDKLEEAVKEYEDKTGKKLEFNREDIFPGGPNEDNIRQMAASVAALRLGDANREANVPLYSQSGGKYDIDQMPSRDCMSAEAEGNGAVISITTDDGVRHELNDQDDIIRDVPEYAISKQVVLGERNMVGASAEYDKETNSLQEHITLKSGNDVPFCTTNAILERCGELSTINGAPRSVKITLGGVKNESELTPAAKKAMEDMINTINTKRNKKNTDFAYAGLKEIVWEFDDGSRKTIVPDYGNK